MKAPLLFYGAVFGGSFLCVLLLIPLCRRLAFLLGALDQPDHNRKVHERSIPYLGGLAFYIAWLLMLAALSFFAPDRLYPEFYALAVVGFPVILLGVYDDICDLSSKIKLPLELIMGGSLYFWGFKSVILSHPLGGTVYVGSFAVVITALWVAGMMNAVNFTDGLDGLAGGLVAIAAAVLFFVSFRQGYVFSSVVMAFLAGSCLAFLCYNFHPASIFMGDAGALFLGFLFGAATVLERQKGTAVIALSVPVMVVAVPLLDTGLSFLRRLRRARAGRFFTPDRHHIHHRLLALGLSQRQVVLSLYALSLFFGVLAVIFAGLSAGFKLLLLLMAGVCTLLAVAWLRYKERRK